VAHAEITGGTEVHVEQGSTLNLTCVVKNSKEKPHYLLWYHKNETIDYTSPRGGISVVNSENNSPEITSTLLIYQVGDSDSGKYSCRPSNTDVATTTVYVIRGKYSNYPFRDFCMKKPCNGFALWIKNLNREDRNGFKVDTMHPN